MGNIHIKLTRNTHASDVTVSSQLYSAGDTLTNIRVLALPPKKTLIDVIISNQNKRVMDFSG